MADSSHRRDRPRTGRSVQDLPLEVKRMILRMARDQDEQRKLRSRREQRYGLAEGECSIATLQAAPNFGRRSLTRLSSINREWRRLAEPFLFEVSEPWIEIQRRTAKGKLYRAHTSTMPAAPFSGGLSCRVTSITSGKWSSSPFQTLAILKTNPITQLATL
jgi:hypothetical protein